MKRGESGCKWDPFSSSFSSPFVVPWRIICSKSLDILSHYRERKGVGVLSFFLSSLQQCGKAQSLPVQNSLRKRADFNTATRGINSSREFQSVFISSTSHFPCFEDVDELWWHVVDYGEKLGDMWLWWRTTCSNLYPKNSWKVSKKMEKKKFDIRSHHTLLSFPTKNGADQILS